MPSSSLSVLISRYLEIQETKRKALWKSFRKWVISGFAFVILASIATGFFFDLDLGVLYGFLALGYIIYKSVTRFNAYKEDYTQSFVKPLMNHLYPDLKYEAKKFVDQQYFRNSGIFPKVDHYKGEDLFRGRINGVTIGFSEINASKSNKKRKNSRSSSKSAYFLQGLFFYMEGSFSIYQPIYIRNINTVISIRDKYFKTPLDEKQKVKVGDGTQFEVFTEPGSSSSPEIPASLFKRLQYLEDLLRESSLIAELKFSARSNLICVALQPIKIFEPPAFKKSSELQKKLQENLSIIHELISLKETIST